MMSLPELWRRIRARVIRDPLPPEDVAAGWALGMFIGCSVPFGLQLIVAVPLAMMMRVSKIGATIRPFLDDFAQITGVSLKTAGFDYGSPRQSAKKVVKKLRGRNAVMLKNSGALCVGSSEDDAQAVKLVTEKGCMAYVAADLYGKEDERINFAESLLMRVIYKTKYSKKAETNKKGN